jgi:D-aspartate ligase
MLIGILDGQAIQALIFAKQLKQKGHKVILFCSEKLSYGYCTRYAFKKILSPSSETEIKKYHNFILDFLNHNQIDVLVPMNDYSAKYLSKYKKDLESKVNFIAPDYDIFMRGYDKNQLMQVCKKFDFPHPQTIDLENIITEEDKFNFKFPALIKPNETTGARGFTMVNSFDELNSFYSELKKQFGPCHLQQYIPNGGRQYKVQLLVYNNNILATSVIEKHRFYPIKGGSSCFNSTIINNDLVSICKSVLKKIQWQGFADFDLIEDPRNGSVLIMEINPRVPACIKASVVSGIDYPNAIVDLSLNNPVKEFDYKHGQYLRYFSMDLLWLLKSENKFKNIGKWFNKMFSSNHFLQDGDWLDPFPFIIGSISGLFKQLNPKFRKQKKGMNS